MKLIAALAVSVPMLVAQSDRPAALHSVTAVRHWSLSGITRVAIEVSGDFRFRTDRLHDPERIYFDILDARPRIDSRRFYSEDLDDKLVKRIRAAERAPGIVRVVLELTGDVEATTSQLANPNRLIIELRGAAPAVAAPLPVTPPALPAVVAPSPPKIEPPAPPVALPASPAVSHAPPAALPASPAASHAPPAALPASPAASHAPTASPAALPASPAASHAPPAPPAPPAASPAPLPASTAALPEPPAGPVEIPKAAKHTSTGNNSLTRALGLKIDRIVIDAGHGGPDQGTEGPKGLLEKDLVLDVALRLGKLVEDRMGAEVIYTRSDDTFIPLEQRTALANEKKADLFLSIHANSSPYPRIAGVETYYLNFTDSKEALDVASRENASSQKSIFELQDIIQKITLHDKAEESKEFASRVQAALYAFSGHNVPGEKNRGVKKAPFVVLIGASMPSVLAEIGFLSNPREEALLKKPDYRQKLAEALFRGVARYSDGLSHFQVAQK
jgi:N-acetylmuramoyl-L-alanine amidase